MNVEKIVSIPSSLRLCSSVSRGATPGNLSLSSGKQLLKSGSLQHLVKTIWAIPRIIYTSYVTTQPTGGGGVQKNGFTFF
jgi:hypothetical protein